MVDARPVGSRQRYTTFEISVVALSEDAATVRIGVTNTGGRRGSAVVLVHAGLAASSVERPRKRLVGFDAVTPAASVRCAR